MFNPNRYHKLELKRLAKYLKNTQDRGIVLDTNSDIFKVDAYPDSDFTGMHRHKNHNAVVFAKRCTGINITLTDCTVL